jgi:hypothetical protein
VLRALLEGPIMIGVPKGDSVPWEAQPDARGRDPRRLRCLGSALSAAPMRRRLTGESLEPTP